MTAAVPTLDEAVALVNEECRLLDEVRYEEWLELFTPDGLYWIPVADGPPEDAVSIVYDDAERRAERVFRTLHTPVLDQNPRSRTVHLASNVEVQATGDGPRILSSQLIAEMRAGGEGQLGLGQPRLLAGRCEHRVRFEGGRWRIALKKLVLIQADQPLYNLTFIL